jgi:molybdopterin-binding protein
VNLFTGTLSPLPDGGAVLSTPDGDIVVAPDRAVPTGATALASIRPIDISLHATEPEGSARNVFHGEIVEIGLDGDRARIRLATRPPLTAEITAGSVARMDLRAGIDVWASFKAVEVSLQIEDGDGSAVTAGTLGR